MQWNVGYFFRSGSLYNVGCAENYPSPTHGICFRSTQGLRPLLYHSHFLESFAVDACDAVEREAHGLGRGVELRLQPLELAHVAVPATPHAEGGEEKGV